MPTNGGRLMMGLMSGTSHDGIDAAIVRFGAATPRLVFHRFTPHPPALRSAISNAMRQGTTESICALNFALGEAFAQAALNCAKAAGISISRVDAIASHGQTIHHIPPGKGRAGSTLQIGEPAIIAHRTGRPVISGFRGADMAAGGQGAPLVPFADHVLLGHMAPVAAHNLGGISNVTLVTKKLSGVIAFDTGPANCLMDAATRMHFGTAMDRGGRLARSGSVNKKALASLMAHPYLRKAPPKSTGPETFSQDMVIRLTDKHRLEPRDLMATLAEFTAQSIGQAYGRFVKAKKAVFSGGGTKNPYLMERIAEAIAPVEIVLSGDIGIPSAAKEAMAFAILGHESLMGRPSNVPSATGAKRAVILGSITRP